MSLYSSLMEANKSAFAQGYFMVAYHALSAALYCTITMNDATKMEIVLDTCYTQLEELSESNGPPVFLNAPVVVSLYQSLIKMTRDRILLSRK